MIADCKSVWRRQRCWMGRVRDGAEGSGEVWEEWSWWAWRSRLARVDFMKERVWMRLCGSVEGEERGSEIVGGVEGVVVGVVVVV